MANKRRGRRDDIELCPLLANNDEVGWPTGPRDKLRFMILGDDDAFMDKACATILGKRENRDAFRFGNLEPRKAQVCELQVSVLKTPSYWLEHLESKIFFNSGVKLMTFELQFFESLLFPGPNAFLLVLSDKNNSGKEYYLLHALSDVFGEEVLDYCMVIYIDEVRLNDPKNNSGLMMCGGRYHSLQNTDESVNQLFKKTEAMAQWKSSIFFTNHLECFKKAEKYFEAENEIKQNKLRRELEEHKETAENRKKEMNDMKELNAKIVIELNERIKDDRKKSKDRENQLHSDLDALNSREKQKKEDFQKLKEELIFYKNRENELSNELDALRRSENQEKEDLQKLKQELILYRSGQNELSNKLDALKSSGNQTKEDYQKLKEELDIYKGREILLLSGLDSLKSSENQMMVDFQKLKEELIIYKDRERHLKDDKEKLQREVEQLKDNEKQLQSNLTEAKELDRRVKELDDRQRNLTEREKQLEIREREK